MSYINHAYHIIFSTKNRAPMIEASIREDLCSYIGGIIRKANGALLEMGVVADHVHLL